MLRQDSIERFDGLRRQFGDLAAFRDQGIGCHYGWSSSVAENRQARPLRSELLGEDFREVEEFADAVNVRRAAGCGQKQTSASVLPCLSLFFCSW
jgi:hypothetical protein